MSGNLKNTMSARKAVLILILSLSVVILAYGQENPAPPTPEQYRVGIAKSIADLNVEPSAVWKITDRVIRAKGESIPLRIYYPDKKKSLPILYYIHGGCWVAGDMNTHENICRYLCNMAGCIVISVDYRQPPENKFPAAVEDCFSVLKWVYKHAKKLGGDKHRIALMGDSSGGNLSAAVCLMNRDADRIVPLAMQVLINPVLDLRQNSSSFKTYMGCVLAYLNTPEESLNPYASPLAAESFESIPPTVIITSENDESKDESLLYQTKLQDCGILASLFEIKGIGHFGGLWAANSPDVTEATTIAIRELQRGFGLKMPNKK